MFFVSSHFLDAVVEFDREVYLVEEGDCFMPAVRVATPDLDGGGAHGIGLQCITISANVLPGEGKAGAGMYLLYLISHHSKTYCVLCCVTS